MKPGEIWKSQSPRQRAVMAVLALMAGAALYLWIVLSADQARTQLRVTVAMLRAQSASLEQQAVELGRLRGMPAKPASQSDVLALVQTQAGAAGLSGMLTRIEAMDSNQVKVVFGAVPFADWLAWVGALQSLQMRLDTCRIEALSTPGLVSVTANFVRSRPQ